MKTAKHTGFPKSDVLKPSDDPLQDNTGLEYCFNNALTVRECYQVGNDSAGFSIGGGARLALKENYLKIDYACLPYGVMGLILGIHGK